MGEENERKDGCKRPLEGRNRLFALIPAQLFEAALFRENFEAPASNDEIPEVRSEVLRAQRISS